MSDFYGEYNEYLTCMILVWYYANNGRAEKNFLGDWETRADEAEARLLAELGKQKAEPGVMGRVYGVCPKTGVVRVVPFNTRFTSPEGTIALLKKVITFHCSDGEGRGGCTHFDPDRSLWEHYEQWSVNPPPGFDPEKQTISLR